MDDSSDQEKEKENFSSSRRLGKKVLHEIKSVARMSPAHTPRESPTSPPDLSASKSPLELPPQEDVSDSDDENEDLREQFKAQHHKFHTDGSLDIKGMTSPPNSGPKPKTCALCHRSFTVFRAKHTCQLCHRRVCDDCSKSRVRLYMPRERKRGSRLCDPCAKSIHATGSPRVSDLAPTEQGQLARRKSLPNTADASPPLLHRRNSSADLTPRTSEVKDENGVTRVRRSTSAPLQPTLSVTWERKINTWMNKLSASDMNDPTHLRSRHRLPFLLVCGCILLRLAIADAPIIGESFWLVETLDWFLSLRLVVSYLLALILFDEFFTQEESRRPRRRKSSAVPTRTSQTNGEPEEEIQVDTGEEKMEENLSFEKLVYRLAECVERRTPQGELTMGAFMEACNHTCSFVLVFGRATSFAASTVGGYIETVHKNVAQWPEPETGAWDTMSLRSIIEHEVDEQVATIGGKKQPSCCRCILRLLWFLQFVQACIKYTMLESESENCAAGATKAYEETLGKRHPWIIRKGVVSAFGTIPTRSDLIREMHVDELPDGFDSVRLTQERMERIAIEVEKLMQKHDLLDIK